MSSLSPGAPAPLARVTSLLRDLVAIPSVNPCFKKVGQPDDLFGEARLAAYVEAWGRQQGFHVERQPVLPGRDNVLVRLEGRGGSPSGRIPHLLWEAHMDTVQVDNMVVDPFKGEVRDGRLYGRGATDTKGSLAAMMAAMEMLAQEPARPTVTLAATVDEEYRYRGILKVIESGPAIDAAVVGEPTSLNLVVAHKGCIRFAVATHGRAAHTSRAEEGVNAIEHMAELINALKGKVSAAFEGRRHPLVGPPTLTVSLIQGGIGINTVPDRCEIQVDRRLIPGETPEGATKEVEAMIEEIRAELPHLEITLGEPFVVDPPMEIAPDEPIVAAMRKGTARAGIAHASVQGVPFGTDASKVVLDGTPALVFGPGTIEDAHTADESVDLNEVAAAAQALAAGALEFLTCA